MNENSRLRVKVVYFRTLFSQSGASLSMGSLAAFLRNKGFSVDICFLEKGNFHSFEKMLEKFSEEKIIVIAKPNFKDCQLLSSLLKTAKNSGKIEKVFFCGPFAALNGMSIVEINTWLDGVIIDQIECVAWLLLITLNEAKPIKECRGGIWREGNIISEYKQCDSYITLDELPFPARDIEALERGSFINIEASRGCIYNCSFCHVPLMGPQKEGMTTLDVRDPIKVVDEIEFLNKNLGKKLFIFNDSVFWAHAKDDERILKFCLEIKKRNLDIHMYVYLRCNPFINDKVLHALADAGLVRVFLGVENASASSQMIFRKPIRNDAFVIIKEKLDKLNINIHIGYIVFEPFSTLNDIQINIDYLYQIGKLFRLGTILEPVRVVPKSYIHKQLIDRGLLDKNIDYRELTYGYRFLYPEVEKLLNDIKNIFSGDFGSIAYEFEYYCTTMSVLDCLIRRTCTAFPTRNISSAHKCFDDIRDEMLEDAYRYFSDLLFKTKNKMSQDETIKKEFVKSFSEKFFKLKIEYFDFRNKLAQSGRGNVLLEVYLGLERIY